MHPGEGRETVAPTLAVVDAGMERWSVLGDRLRSLDHRFFEEVMHHVEVCVAAREACHDRLKSLLMRIRL
jgi:hypothetical protein